MWTFFDDCRLELTFFFFFSKEPMVAYQEDFSQNDMAHLGIVIFI